MNLKCRRCRADWGQHMLVNENMEHLCYNRDIEEKNVCMQNNVTFSAFISHCLSYLSL